MCQLLFFQPSTFAIANAFTFYGMDRNYRVIVCCALAVIVISVAVVVTAKRA